MKIFLSICGALVMTVISCDRLQNFDEAKVKSEVLETVYAHNKAWTVLEDLNEQKKYVHKNIVFISPPFKKIKSGIKQYLDDYQVWIDHATVHHFKEVDPVVHLYNEGMFAVVTYKIDMSFDYDGKEISEWHGVDKMTLVRKGGKWLITSDMFAKEVSDQNNVNN